MTGKRLWHTFRLCTARGGSHGRAEYIRKHHIFASMGKNCSFQGRIVPLYPNLIRFGDNVVSASRVTFITHDGISTVMNRMSDANSPDGSDIVLENIGCIEVGNNVFIGAGATICSNVRIGNDVIITAGSVVSKDVPPNSVMRGIPAKKVCDFDVYIRARACKRTYPENMAILMGTSVSPQLAEWLWADFYKKRQR